MGNFEKELLAVLKSIDQSLKAIAGAAETCMEEIQEMNKKLDRR